MWRAFFPRCHGPVNFYATHKSITGRRAHNPIHPGGNPNRRCSSVLGGETTRRPVQMAAPFHGSE
ncbi:hypothetical protein B7T09_07835 [Cronobacter sakazakii]|uniref:Uncharacterized protein n=1 Tax=Cronobacter sakazakii TaxID=28141 RepID=A0AA45HFI5_CROSK|nr:hypothetical protein B7T09_07835 [Cronobacter sakazakii]PUV99854.1 hypothetical protein B7T12_02235 [Cronobacter sakazakii]PUW04718.1 hypothetical protein B7T07_12815 [Cronobacter sakazakii]